MTALYQAMLSQAVPSDPFSVGDVSQFSATEIRQTMSELVAANRLDLANALAAAGQSLYPESEDIIAMSALLAEMQQDWIGAEELLSKLVDLQGEAVTAFTWRHLIRVLRCQCEPGKAMQAARQALAQYPQETLLIEELASLQALVFDNLPLSTSEHMH
jgi:tetratricopeptide (TPR) repeat protein